MANTPSFDESLAAHLSAIAKRDSAAFESTLTTGTTLTFIAPNGTVTLTTAQFKAVMRDWFSDKDWSWELTPISRNASEHTGVAVFSVAYADKDASGKPYSLRYVLTLVFAKEAAGWKLVHDQNTLIK